MANQIKIRRGLKANLPVLSSGELGLATDTNELFAGTPDGNLLVNNRNLNAIINGNFDVWQRGTSFDAASGDYTADRWKVTRNTAVYNISRQPVTDLMGSQYCMRATYKTAGINDTYFHQGFEASTFQKLKGNKVNISFQARKQGTVSGFSCSLKSTVAEGNVYSGSVLGTVTPILGSTWSKCEFTIDLNTIVPPSHANQGLQLVFFIAMTNINEYVEITPIQLTTGDKALPFQPKTFFEELAMCQRFYEKSGNYTDGVGLGNISLAAAQVANNKTSSTILYKVRKRVSPTVTVYDTTGTPAKASWVQHGVTTVNLATVVTDGNEYGFGLTSTATDSTAVNMVIMRYAADAEL